MKKLKMIKKLMEGNILLYLAAIAAIGISSVITIVNPLVIGATIDSVIGTKPLDAPEFIVNIFRSMGGRSIISRNLWMCGTFIVGLSVINGIFLYLKGKWSAKASENVAKNIREKLYAHLQELPYDYHIKAKTGDLVQRCTSDVETLRSFLAVQLVEIGRTVIIISLIAAIMINLNLKLALVALITIPVIFVYAVIFFRLVQKVFLECDEEEGRLSTVLQENITGVRVVRAFGRQQFEVEKFEKENKKFRDLVYKLIKLLAYYWSVSDFICMSQIGLIVVAGAYFASKGTLSLGTLVVFTTYEGMLVYPVRQLGRILSDMGKASVSAGRIFEILNQRGEDSEKQGLMPEVHGEIQFKNVSFEYEAGKPILKNISFSVKRGQTVAILGPTGSGKTSLVNLLPRLYDYQKGSILIDGVELKTIDKKWIRNKIGIALQEPFLYSKTIKENIGITLKEMSDQSIFEAAETASIHENILEFEEGYETAVGERGVTLSGGQKQRVTIARTIIKDYPVLIFDDSLSAVDTETDARIREALKKRSKDVTTFIISHRVTTLAEADIIIVLDDGRIVQMGSHNELINREGLYKKIWGIQNLDESEEDERTA